MSILITGGAGFIGSSLVDSLISNENKLIVIDNLSSGCISNIEKNIDKIEFYQESLEDFDFSKCSEISSVIHLAAQISVPQSIKHFKNSSSANMLNTIKVLDFCSSNHIPVVYASSSAVYGSLEYGDDSKKDVEPQSPYAADKYNMEIYSNVCNEIYGLSSIGLRFFNVYGPRQNPKNEYSGVISIFIDKLLNRKDITINGGYQTRDFIHINDVIHCIKKSLKIVSEKKVCENLNVLTGKSVTIEKLADLIESNFDYKTNRIFKELRDGDIVYSSGSTEKMIRVLGLDPKKFLSINDGLQDTINSIKSK
ncbi:NAD-dependent epimerase/dehydratase family protein [Gammaproteobacteria bacterium]|jgi:UDP-glucose 4-epimerase|nr:NAD-dependent epimerase/dehydratase family protein [Gammaproteobacteria bacterium]